MKKLYFVLVAVFALLAGCSSEKGDSPEDGVEGIFRLHSFLQDGMVIQQNQPFRLWGEASAANVKITAKASWADREYSCKAGADGTWVLEIPVPAAPSDNAPQSIVISTPLRKAALRDLLIGEVWLLGGQSNMAFAMNQVLNAPDEIRAADYPNIRFFTVQPSNTADPIFDWERDIPAPYGKWYSTSPATAGAQSAVGYYFGRMLHQELGVPVGLVNTSNGGATAQAYTPLEALEGDSRLKTAFVDPYKADPNMNVLVRPAELYNSMVHPLLPLSVRGVAWYQGEGNWDNYPIYPLLMKTLINAWRRNFASSEMPFYYVQIAPWGFDGDTSSQDWFYTQSVHIGYAYQREAQSLTREQVSHSGMAVTMDVGDPDDIHPTNKRPVGERLARLALNQTYGRSDVRCLGPRYNSLKVENGVVKLLFDHAEGLKTNDGQAPNYFYVASAAGQPHRFYPATAEIHGSEVWLTCPDVVTASTTAADVAVRYAFLLYPTTNLENGTGLPAEPFRTDDWSTDISYVY